MKTYFLRVVKPELWITVIFILTIAGISGIIGYDLMQKKRIDSTINDAKVIIGEVALSLTTEKIISPIAVSPQYLAKRSSFIADVNIYPNNKIEIMFNNLSDNKNKFIFEFESVDGLTRGHLTCKGGDVSNRVLPNQCRN